MNKEVLDRILRCPSLPSLPAVAVRILELTSQPDVSIEELSRVIQNDQALTAKILRTVNSSYYGLRRRCTGISQAMVLLGLSAVKSLALSFSLVSTLSAGKTEGFDFIAYWRRALYSAVAARCIARAAGVVMEDEAFLGGLLQDIGMVAMHRALTKRYTQVLAAAAGDHRRLASLEITAFELQHADAGAMLADRWKLPGELIIPIRYHEHPTAAPAQHAEMVRCVGLGNIAHDVLTDRDPLLALTRFRTLCLEWFELDGAIADDLLKKIAEGARQLGPLFQVNTGPAADAETLMAQARTQAENLTIQPSAPTHSPDALRTLLSDGAHRDAMTGTLDPRVFDQQAADAFQAARRAKRPLSAWPSPSTALTASSPRAAPGGDAALVEIATLIESDVSERAGFVGARRVGRVHRALPGRGPDRGRQCRRHHLHDDPEDQPDVVPARPPDRERRGGQHRGRPASRLRRRPRPHARGP
jgi:HD-like signal output (HDOD) protein